MTTPTPTIKKFPWQNCGNGPLFITFMPQNATVLPLTLSTKTSRGSIAIVPNKLFFRLRNNIVATTPLITLHTIVSTRRRSASCLSTWRGNAIDAWLSEAKALQTKRRFVGTSTSSNNRCPPTKLPQLGDEIDSYGETVRCCCTAGGPCLWPTRQGTHKNHQAS